MSKTTAAQRRKTKIVIETFHKVVEGLGLPLMEALCQVGEYDFETIEELGRPYGLLVERKRNGRILVGTRIELQADFSPRSVRHVESLKKTPKQAA